MSVLELSGTKIKYYKTFFSAGYWCHRSYWQYSLHIHLPQVIKVPMVLNQHGIEPTFLELDSWSPGTGFIPIISYNLQCIKLDKERNKIKISLMRT